jgi:hypothetical protein
MLRLICVLLIIVLSFSLIIWIMYQIYHSLPNGRSLDIALLSGILMFATGAALLTALLKEKNIF